MSRDNYEIDNVKHYNVAFVSVKTGSGIITYSIMDLLNSINLFEKLAWSGRAEENARLLIELLDKRVKRLDNEQDDTASLEHLWAIIKDHAVQLAEVAKVEQRRLVEVKLNGRVANLIQVERFEKLANTHPLPSGLEYYSLDEVAETLPVSRDISKLMWSLMPSSKENPPYEGEYPPEPDAPNRTNKSLKKFWHKLSPEQQKEIISAYDKEMVDWNKDYKKEQEFEKAHNNNLPSNMQGMKNIDYDFYDPNDTSDTDFELNGDDTFKPVKK